MRKLIAKLLVVAILLTTMSQTTVVNAQPIYELSENVYLSDGYEVTEKIESEWNDGYVATITIKNTSEVTIRNWDTVQGVCKSALISMGMKSSTAGTVAYYVRKGLEWVV